MRITIIADDGTIYVDGTAIKADLSKLDPEIHAIQWNGVAGAIEYKTIDGKRRPNLPISDPAPFEAFAGLWQALNVQLGQAVVEAAIAARTTGQKVADANKAAPVRVIAD
jgi:hypothetical protein